MSERDDLLISVANEIRTYRQGDLSEPTPEHVDRWLQQFTPAQQLPFIREFNHVIKQTFITSHEVEDFLSSLVTNQELAGDDPAGYWSTANLLNIQQNGQSQKEMLKLFSKCLEEVFGLDLEACGEDGGDFIYLDDVMFSGNRVGNDLEAWIVNDAPQSARVHVIVAAYHTLGQYLTAQKLKRVIANSGKKISVEYWRVLTIENQKAHKNISGVLWPTAAPSAAEVQAYMALPSKYPFEPRQPSAKPIEPFSSEAGRQILESEFLIAGAKIRAMSEKPKSSMKPLGFSPFGVGFGSMLVTYRNCPNNCPIAMWWGDPEATSGALHWYPLLPREGYSSLRNIFDDLTL
ncbi:hypothetical protein QD172_09940 [Cobetia sp. 10Alg 146]|uniref:phosphoribosyltransferase-like protein n=1 Tax=Cobetia sp. 10Alg 146 TaxID=3040019 RepID=UPI00244C3704|nr:hypothetical protein [Cobetia sp. 10Alg 146]MDH2291568.1 hypothetical protein [Cobetia sp. 10Alg 146]